MSTDHERNFGDSRGRTHDADDAADDGDDDDFNVAYTTRKDT